MDSPPSALQWQSHNLPGDGERQPPHNLLRQPPSNMASSTVLSTAPANLTGRRSPSSSSSSPSSPSSSSSSCDSLATHPLDFKRSSRRRHQRRPAKLPLPRNPRPSGQPVDELRPSPTHVSPVIPELYKGYAYQTPSLSRSADLQPSVASQGGIPTVLAQSQDIGAVCHDYYSKKDIAVEEKSHRKLLMWRAACAMAHAYVCQLDAYQQEDRQLELIERLDMDIVQKGGKKQDIHDGQPLQPVQTVYLSPSCFPINSSSKDQASPSSICATNDVVCIDEVVNPTQAAEWFGALFLSTSALVS